MKGDPDAEYLGYARGRLPALRSLAVALCGDASRADDSVQQTLTSPLRTVRINLRSGDVVPYPPETAEIQGGQYNERGWWTGRLAVASPAGRLELPRDPELSGQAAYGLNADGSVIVGAGTDAAGVSHALVRHCR